MKRLLGLVAGTFVAAYILVCLGGLVFQERLVYFPTREIETGPGDVNLPHESSKIPLAEGTFLSAWFIPAQEQRAVVLFCHGNGGNISHRLETARVLRDAGMSVLLFDYRGYGESPGSPSENRTYEDAQAAWQFLTQVKSVPGKKIVIWGESLGGGVASWLATQVDAGALVLQSTFTSVADVAEDLYPLWPRAIVRIRYPTIERLPNIREPLLVIHSPDDELISYRFGKILFETANPPKEMITIRGDHNSGLLLSTDVLKPALEKFIATYVAAEPH